MKLPIDTTREAEFKVSLTKDGQPVEKTYRLRFAMRELYKAEQVLGIKALANGARGVNEIIQRLTDGSLDSFVFLFGVMAKRHAPAITDEEVYDAIEADFEGAMRAVYHVLNIALPKPEEASDPKAPTTETPTEETAISVS